MSFFTQFEGSRLYIGLVASGDAGWLAYLLPRPSPSTEEIDLDLALKQLPGSFLFSFTAPLLSTTPLLDAFIGAVDQVIARSPADRGFLWLMDPTAPTISSVPLMGIAADGSYVSNALQAPIFETLSLNVRAGVTLQLDGDTLRLGTANGIFFSGASAPGAPQASQIPAGTLPLSGAARGCIRFPVFLQRQFLHDGWNWGFQFQIPHDDPVRSAIGEWLPLAFGHLPNPGDMLGFDASYDPSDPWNAHAIAADRSVLVFTGQNQDGTATVLSSCYATTYGELLTLAPVAGPLDMQPDAARFLFNAGAPDDKGNHDFQIAPEGDFVIHAHGPSDGGTYDLICGLQGTEFVAFQPFVDGGYAGDRLRFTARSPAYAPRYPFTEVSPVGAPVDVNAPLLDATYTSSWGTVARAPGAPGAAAYVAQPKGAALYGRDALIHSLGEKTLFGPMTPSVTLPSSAFPMVPYAGASAGDGVTALTAERMADFERQVVSPTRRRRIADGGAGVASSKAHALKLADMATATPYNTTTPSGLLVTVDAAGQWSKILLGQNLSPTLRQMSFCNPGAELQQAFATSDLFLVTANAAHLGAFSADGSGACGPSATFANRINVGDWSFEAAVGQNNRYDDYADVMIVKGRRGPLWDPQNPAASLVASPDMWTQKDAFAAPSDLVPNPAPPPDETVAAPNPDELIALSYWLQRYFQDALDQAEPEYFAKFNTIAKDPAWTGILFLRMKISSIPDDLVGIVAGVQAPELFNAHHFGIEISQIANDPAAPDIALTTSSSMFGLIYYVDPAYIAPPPGIDPRPVPPTAGTDYQFRVLTLKALFENTAVQRFQSYAQLTLNSLFDMPVVSMGEGGNPYATLVLRGSYQDNGGRAVYSLGTTATSTFYFDNNLFTKIEVDSAQMSTRDSGANGQIVSWFALSGFLDFAVVQANDSSGAFDILSFGSHAGEDQLRRGLAYSNLGVRMTFPVADPATIAFAFSASEIRFDMQTSTPRPDSLFVNFALGLQGLVQGSAQTSPEADGFLNVVTDATLTGVNGDRWYGLAYQLNMGTPGNLAGTIGLTSGLLTAWAPVSADAGRYRASLGIQLPGTGGGANLISLQNVLRLSIGQMWLTYDRDKRSFLLMLTEIALKFMGLLKIPPSGSTLFYLFGNPQSEGKASGLGWYAMYNNTPASRSKSARLLGKARGWTE
ncbi:hypothetical protein U0F71_06255 [Burkholderia pseudomallei]|uniref:hypothetical protein n=1 Tax=Burkholderia pseudomallei TaxID=28450 RepID=UPI002AB4642A|nr:hypothetical protein [Burkholderia pseudomallei]MDY7815323.1 hypothetical protein [Burkholderia pseudomallei]MDY7862116.1 hypothetical protein [Burkholderia pseudomallei]